MTPLANEPTPHAPAAEKKNEAGRTPDAADPEVPAETEHRNGAQVGRDQAADWHVEAGRKGARRIHQLIEQGKLYEREHGLKRGRQRLRQLIEEGKLYEQEHGLAGAVREGRGERVARVSREELLRTLFDTLLRLAKPKYRADLVRVMEALERE
jgi:hypothetical protein